MTSAARLREMESALAQTDVLLEIYALLTEGGVGLSDEVKTSMAELVDLKRRLLEEAKALQRPAAQTFTLDLRAPLRAH